jgi:imidazolonepropionase-like amidohydrolase
MELRTEASRQLPEAEITRAKNAADRLQQVLKNAKLLFDTGILLAAGTDAPYPGLFQGEGIHHELELLVEAGLRPLDAITLATRNAARLMNANTEWGTLESGKFANLIVINGRPDKRIVDTQKVEMVMQLGKILDREKLKLDPSKDPGFRQVSPISAAK